jgi:hypothetical protein
MPRRLAIAFLAALFPATVLAQGVTPSLPGAPQPTPNYPGGPRLPQGAAGGSGSYAIAAAANEHAAYLGRRQCPAHRRVV